MHRHMRTHRQREGDNYESDGSTDSSIGSMNNNYTNDAKRKMIDEDGTSLKRRLKTINNNNIVKKQVPRFCCPVCVRSDFSTILNLENHMDREHPSIPAKCRYCEVVFKSHKALNVHQCDANGFKDLTCVDFSSDKFPLIAKSMCEQGVHTPLSNQYECPHCKRAFPCASAVDIHKETCRSLDAPQDFSIRKRRREPSETSDEDAKRDDFFAHLDLQNKSTPQRASFNITDSESNKSLSRTDIKSDRKMLPYDTKDLADIQSIINVTSSGGFLKQLDKSVPRFVPKELPFSRDEEEAQDAFTAEFRKMKLRGEFPCQLCVAIFPNLRALKGHNRVHLSAAGSGPYRCNMCPFSIHDKAAVIRHMRTHNGDRPYECSLCNYAFTTKANCERHLRNRHGKVTREDVKSSIIYHPSEDSSCDDPVKKMQIYNSSYDDEEVTSKDRTSPIANLKDIAGSETVKIQVKSLDQLIKPNVEEADRDKDVESFVAHQRPIDLSMDVLDLSRKGHETSGAEVINEEDGDQEYDDDDEEEVTAPKLDLSMFEKNQQIFMAQQQFLSEHFPKIDPAHYFQLSQLYRNLMFPTAGFPIHPLFLQHNFMTQNNEHKDMHPKDRPRLPMFQPSLIGSQMFAPPPGSAANIVPHSINQGKELQQRSSSPQEHINLAKSPQVSNNSPQQLPSSTQQTSLIHNSGPVKMVIKNGVLMPKQKQRRYRTERPFACEHCSARFTLRSNMERHIKQQHPQYWAQRQRNGHNILRRGSGSNNSGPIIMPPAHPQQLPPQAMTNQLSAISDQVKYAILAQQLKCHSERPSKYLKSMDGSAMPARNDVDTVPSQQEDDEESQLVIDEDSEPEDLSAAKRVASTILEEATRLNTSQASVSEVKDFDLNIASNLIPREPVGSSHKDFVNGSKREENHPISK